MVKGTGNRRMCHCEDVFDPAGSCLETVDRDGMVATA